MSTSVKIKKVTLKSVAEAAGVSVPTASQILNNKANNYCSKEKKRLVRQVAHELNYQPNFGYQLIHGQKTNTIGIICSSKSAIQQEHIKNLLLNLMTEFEKLGYAIYTSVMINSEKENIKKISSLINRGCSAFVLLGHPLGGSKMEKIFIRNNIDYVTYGLATTKRIITDSSYAIKCYIDDLMQDGRDNFKIITTLSFDDQFSRMNGLMKAFPELNTEQLVQNYVIPIDLDIQQENETIEDIFKIGYDKTKEIIEKDANIQGIIYHSDYFALGGARYLSEKGYKIGEDIKIYGYNNVKTVRLAPYPINTAFHDIEKACEVITDKLSQPGQFNIILNPQVII